jgi:photosystem II stability/assembly factor-like uncharacterized protein
LTWLDLHQGQIVDPSFVDASYGFAHSPLDTLSRNPSRLYSTADGGHTWHTVASPCDSETPWLAQTVAVSPATADVLCVEAANYATFSTWEIAQFKEGSTPIVLAHSGAGGLNAVNVFRFVMRPGGDGLIFGDQIYRTTDNGTTWTPTSSAGARVQNGSFTATGIGYFTIRDTGRFTGIVTTSDGGSVWRELARWPFFGSQ